MARRTHIDRLLELKAISTREHAKLKAKESVLKEGAETIATEHALKAISKAARDVPPNSKVRGRKSAE